MIKYTSQYILIFTTFLFFASPLFPQVKQWADEKEILSLISKFSDGDSFVNGDAINTLVKIGSPAVDHLIKSLKHTDDAVRICSAVALYKMAPAAGKTIHFLI
jgi:hypothetical protein